MGTAWPQTGTGDRLLPLKGEGAEEGCPTEMGAEATDEEGLRLNSTTPGLKVPSDHSPCSPLGH